jgi:hypothetical protein
MVKVSGPLVSAGSSYAYAFKEHKIYNEDEIIHQFKRYEVLERDEYFVNPTEEVKELEGLKRLKQFEELVYNGYSYKPHKFQRGFLQNVVKGIAEYLVGTKDWLVVGPSVIKQRGWREISKMILAKAPRRFGKSISVGMVANGIAVVKLGSVQSIFSTGRRASRNLLEIIYKMLCDIGMADRVVRFNRMQLHSHHADSYRRGGAVHSGPNYRNHLENLFVSGKPESIRNMKLTFYYRATVR